MIRRGGAVLLLAGSLAAGVEGAAAPAAAANPVCTAAGIVSGLLGRACNVVSGPVGKLAGKIFGGGGGARRGLSAVGAGAGVTAAGVWAFVGAKFALKETSKVLGQTTSPQLGSTWFSATYWRMTAIAALLTLPFLCAAAIQALMRSDLAMLVRAAFGYLPLAALAIAIAAPLTTLLLAGSDEMSGLVASATGTASTHLLRGAGLFAGFASLSRATSFFTFVVSSVTIAGALALWLELIIREAAVYVIVLMLPLAFAAMVWPARRVWAIRALELLVALILSKFAIVAVLTLGGAALNRIGHFGIGAAIAGIALLMLAAFAPWALLRLLPLSELASGVASGLRREAAGSATGMTNSVAGVWPPTGGYAEDSTGSSYGAPSIGVESSARSGSGSDVDSPAADGLVAASGGGVVGVPTSNGGGGESPAGGAETPEGAANGSASANGQQSTGVNPGPSGLAHVKDRPLTLDADHLTVPPPGEDRNALPERQPPDGDE